MKTKDQVIEDYIKALSDDEITLDYFGKTDELSKVEKEYVLAEYVKNIDTDSTPYYETIDVIDRPQFNIFTWGCPDADAVFTPIEKHHFILLVGSSGMGKTSFTFDFALKNAEKGNKVLYLSLEMTTENIFTRIARDYAGINKYQWQDRSRITDGQKQAYNKKKKELKAIKNFEAIGFGAGDNTSLNGILRFIQERSPDMVIVDNFNLISTEMGKNDNQQDEFVSEGFMNFAKKHNIATVVVHHLNKANTVRGSQKIKDNSSGMFSCFRELENYEELEAIDKSAFIVTEIKDREFGRPGNFTYYFHRGKFYGEPQCEQQAGFAIKAQIEPEASQKTCNDGENILTFK